MKKKQELKSFYSCIRTINPEFPVLWLLSYHLSRNLPPPRQQHSSSNPGASIYPLVSEFRLGKQSLFLRKVSPWLSALEDRA